MLMSQSSMHQSELCRCFVKMFKWKEVNTQWQHPCNTDAWGNRRDKHESAFKNWSDVSLMKQLRVVLLLSDKCSVDFYRSFQFLRWLSLFAHKRLTSPQILIDVHVRGLWGPFPKVQLVFAHWLKNSCILLIFSGISLLCFLHHWLPQPTVEYLHSHASQLVKEGGGEMLHWLSGASTHCHTCHILFLYCKLIS